MKFIKIFIFSIALSTSSFTFADAASTEEAKELLKIMNLATIFQKSIDTMLNLQLQQNPKLVPYKEVMVKFFNKHMSFESLKPEFIKIYADAFTAKELKEIAAFYATPSGQKTLEKMPELMAKGGALGAKRVQDNMKELQDMIKTETEKQKASQ